MVRCQASRTPGDGSAAGHVGQSQACHSICGRCTSRAGVSTVRRVLGAYELAPWPEDTQRQEVVEELRDQFRDEEFH